MKVKSELLNTLDGILETDKDLSQYSTFKTGGDADFFVEAKSVEDIKRAIRACTDNNLAYFVLGGGSNLLISDDGFRGMVIHVNMKELSLVDETSILCGAGVVLMDLVNFAAENSLTGLEFASGIWGSVGGAVFGNAGAYGGEVKDVITSVKLIDIQGNIKDVPPAYCQFEYRKSKLKESKEIVLEVLFKLSFGNKKEIVEKVNEIIDIRNKKHPVDGLCAGSFFKNIPDASQPHGKLPAGKLLEEVGAKELSVGGARVYEKHANIIVNDGTATSKDILNLADMMKKKVFEKFDILLEEEVIFVGDI
ncbi:MAG: UDP-N-acetylmuramate dehydrogenase [Calditrichaeota bacterium]|nr:MAG: UDP-N-acetylmuramate dehydrogenase [Calditrichota bacterium]